WDCLEHALGKNVARGCAKRLAQHELDAGYVQRHLLRFAGRPERARAVVQFLYRQGPCPPAQVPVPAAAPAAVAEAAAPERPRTVTATNRGDIAAPLVHVYRGGANEELRQALDRYVRQEAERSPRFDGKVALVLDASASTLGYGEREYCCLSQSQALRLVLEQCCANLRVVTVGGAG